MFHACSDMVTQLLDSMGDDLEQKMDDLLMESQTDAKSPTDSR